MSDIRYAASKLGLLLAALFLLSACSTAPYRYESLESIAIQQRAVEQRGGSFVIRASVPSPEESERLFGIPVYDREIQPVWLEVVNNSSERARFLISSVDGNYFSPHEVAYIHRKRFSKEGWLSLEQRLHQMAMPRQIAAGDTASGFVFTNFEPGTKTFNAAVLSASEPVEFEQFSFFVDVPGFRPDYADIDFYALYDSSSVRRLSEEGLRAELSDLPCCTTDRSGDGQGKPLNIVLVAQGPDLLKALLTAGWSQTAYERTEAYLNSVDHLFGRPPDAVFGKNRSQSTERAKLLLWLTPRLTDEKPVWAAQLQHAIGRRFEIGEWVFGSRMDPDVDDGRNYLLQDLWYAQALDAFAWSRSTRAVSKDKPMQDFRGNPFFADGYRVVMFISGEPVSIGQTRQLDWDNPLRELGITR